MENNPAAMAKGSSFCFDLNALPPQINHPPTKVITNEDLEMENLGIVNWSPLDLNITPPQTNHPPVKVITNEVLEMEKLGIVNWSPFYWDLNITPPQIINLPPAKSITNEDGHYIFGIEAYLTPRYEILSKMGAGAFGQVLECWDCHNKKTVAVKVSRSLPKFRNAATGEIDVLLQLTLADKSGEHFVRILDCFDHRDHICIVFEKLGPSLHDLLRKNCFQALPLDLVRDIGRQLFKSIAVMHELQLVHTDLKPENILLVSSDFISVSYHKHLPTLSAIKVIDFGSSTFGYQNHSHLITTRSYRAPEVILGNEWSYPCDMWSIGCILIEFCTGRAPFRTPQDLEHLVMMEVLLGPLPHQIHTTLQEALQSKSSKQSISKERLIDIFMLDSIEDLVMSHVSDSATANDLVDLLRRLLRYDPAERLKARDAITHPFFARC